ncbi:hypothetical protein D9M69_464860 [compost metagenome]
MEDDEYYANYSLSELQELMRECLDDMREAIVEMKSEKSSPDKALGSAQFFLEFLPGYPRHRETPPKKYNRSTFSAFFDQVLDREQSLVPGCIVACDLAGALDHTGIYVGRNRIVERNGDGSIKKTSVHDFMNSSALRSGINLYVACAKGKIISSPAISRRAREMVDRRHGYDLIHENCHRFSVYCATGRWQRITTFSKLTDILESEFGEITWRSTRSWDSASGRHKAM